MDWLPIGNKSTQLCITIMHYNYAQVICGDKRAFDLSPESCSCKLKCSAHHHH